MRMPLASSIRTTASTLTVVLLVVLAIIAIGQFVILDKRIHYR